MNRLGWTFVTSLVIAALLRALVPVADAAYIGTLRQAAAVLNPGPVTVGTSNPAASGLVRLPNNAGGVVWRNAANNADLALDVNGANVLLFNGTLVSHQAAQVTAVTATGTYTTPSNALELWVRCVGGGGGGGNSDTHWASGGGAGAYSEKLISSPAASYPVTIGSGGAAQSAGGTTAFGSVVTGIGGGVGGAASANSGTGGIAGSGGDLNVPGSPGEPGQYNVNGGNGGASIFGGSGIAGAAGGGAATGYGSGGAGAGTSGNGGAGASGVCIVTARF